MTSQIINVLLTSFPGLGLPHTLVIPISASKTVNDLWTHISNRLPQVSSRLILTTTSNKEITTLSSKHISSLLSSDGDTFLPLRLSAPLCGGKGGFGSQLRAAGGRMSSRRKKNVGESNSSNRNLDGRRLRTVAEAKALAEYLAVKPDMEKKEKEARRKRWEQVIETAERRENELRNEAKGRVDAQWLEDKERACERIRESVAKVMASGDYTDNLKGISRTSDKPDTKPIRNVAPVFCYGFDEDDDEFMSDESEEDSEAEEEEEEVQEKREIEKASGEADTVEC